MNLLQHAPKGRRAGGSSRCEAVGRLICVAVLLWAFLPKAQPTISKEYQVKAAFLYNFIQYVEWPASAFSSADSPLVIGILGDDPFGQFLDRTVTGELVHGRQLIVRRGHTLAQLSPCHALFVCRSERSHQAEILAATSGHPILTVGDVDGLARRGAVLNFVIEEGQVRFEVNLKTANASGLKVSSHLLKLARIVDK